MSEQLSEQEQQNFNAQDVVSDREIRLGLQAEFTADKNHITDVTDKNYGRMTKEGAEEEAAFVKAEMDKGIDPSMAEIRGEMNHLRTEIANKGVDLKDSASMMGDKEYTDDVEIAAARAAIKNAKIEENGNKHRNSGREFVEKTVVTDKESTDYGRIKDVELAQTMAERTNKVIDSRNEAFGKAQYTDKPNSEHLYSGNLEANEVFKKAAEKDALEGYQDMKQAGETADTLRDTMESRARKSREKIPNPLPPKEKLFAKISRGIRNFINRNR